MKQLFSIIAIFLVTTLAIGQGQKSFDLKFHAYSISVPVDMNKAGKDGKHIPLIAADKNGKPSASPFGVFFNAGGKSLSSIPVMEITDATTNQIVKSISLEEFFGKENSSWKKVSDATGAEKNKNVSRFEFNYNGKKIQFVRTIEEKKDNGLPLGKSIVFSFSVQTETPMNLHARFLTRIEGKLRKAGGLYVITPSDTSFAGHPAILLHVTPSAKLEQDEKNSSFILTNSSISANPKASTVLFSFTVTGTSVEFVEHTTKQIENIASYLTSKKAAPNMVSTTTVNKTSVSPGDTLIYTIYSHNIGTAPAADIVINNPVPEGSTYIEGTAAGTGTTVSVSREPSNGTQAGRAKSISWNYSSPFLPGEERSVSFQVIAR
jgi:uncharacterized repeat protein (TIGR01451 family)